ncbi:hypothetical protein BKA56DRAFT_601232 [Ilyonectria sp. MPI-CAGE-AT-0026]|nr:hypothetical protein BKA56DRAFT_601232 [Ilyonectria sp. MPI-CAGE-AT-0026]
MKMTAAGFIDIIYVTDDFAHAACFEVGQTYRLEYRQPSSPGRKTGISLTKERLHYGWVRERSRKPVDDVLQAGLVVLCKLERCGKRWSKMDWRLGIEREWQEGTAFFWQEDDIIDTCEAADSSSLV